MKRTLITIAMACLILAAAVLANAFPPSDESKWMDDGVSVSPKGGRSVTIGSAKLTGAYAAGSLPGSPSSGDVIIVTGGLTACDNTTGGGSYVSIQRYNGASWDCIGDGGAAAVQLDGLTDVTGNGTQYYVLSDDGDGTYSFQAFSAFESIIEGFLDLPDLQGNLTLSRISDAGTAAAANTGTSSGNVPALITCCSLDPETNTTEGACTTAGGTWDAVCLPFSISPTVTAADVSIADAGSKITATDVEGALQENRTAIDLNTAKTTNATHTGDVIGSEALTIANGALDYAHMSADALRAPTISGDPDTLDDTLATNGNHLYDGGYIIYNAAGEATLDAFTAVGQTVSIKFYPSVAIIVNPDSAQTITKNGVALSQGEALINSSEFGLCVLTYLGSNSIDADCSASITEETP